MGSFVNNRCSAASDQDREIPETDLLSPLQIRDVVLKNRIAMSPMCQYSSEDGFANKWHEVHLGSRAAGGAALIMVEATAVLPEGRITPGDMGIWKNEHIHNLTKIAEFVHSQGAVPGIQLAHAGRKASCDLPWKGGAKLAVEQGGWETYSSSAIPFSPSEPSPKALTEKEIEQVISAFEAAAKRALQAGFRVIEIHAAHGYLLHEFLSPLSNQRTDEYGGSLENRMRFPLRVAEKLRAVIPDILPLFVRISGTDWVEGGWDVHQSVGFAKQLKHIGVDLIDVSSGGIVPKASIPVSKGYQVPLASEIKREAQIMTAAVGLITEVAQANEIITGGDADLVCIGRELLRDPYWPLKAQAELGAEPCWPLQYGYAVKRRK